MTEDAFARRFYADRAELDSLGIHLTVDRPADGFSEQENYSLAPEAFFLPSIAFSDAELAALQTALSLLDGEFAYAEPLRLALQQLTWGRPSPLGSPAQRAIGLGITGSRRRRRALRPARQGRHRDLPAQADRVRVLHDRRPARPRVRKVDPYELLFEGGQFYLVGWSHERGGDPRVPPLAHPRQGRLRDQGRARLPAPGRLRPARLRQPHPVAARRPGRHRRDPRLRPDRLARRAQLRPLRHARARRRRRPGLPHGVRDRRGSCSPGRSATSSTRTCSGRRSSSRSSASRLERVAELHRGEPFTSVAAGRPPRDPDEEREAPARQREAAGIRPERFARLVTLASVLIQAGRRGERLRGRRRSASSCRSRPQELREDVAVLNVVNFGGGAYVLYAEVLPTGEIEVDPEPYSDTFDRPARLLPIEARALLAAIELLGVHLSEHLLDRPRQARARARRHRQGGPAGLQRAHGRRDRAPGRRGDRGEPPDRARVLRGERGRASRPASRSRTR